MFVQFTTGDGDGGDLWQPCDVDIKDDTLVVCSGDQKHTPIITIPLRKCKYTTIRRIHPPEWEENAQSCYVCLCPFTMITRRHHCRACGRTLCQKCSPKSMVLPSFSFLSPVRVCDRCYDQHINRLLDMNLRPHPSLRLDIDYGAYTPSLLSSIIKRLRFGFCSSDRPKRPSSAPTPPPPPQQQQQQPTPATASLTTSASDATGMRVGNDGIDELFFTLPTAMKGSLIGVKSFEGRECWLMMVDDDHDDQFMALATTLSRHVVADTHVRLPSLVSEWSMDDVISWLVNCVGLRVYQQRFRHHNVNGLMLTRLSDDDLITTLHIHNTLHRRKILRTRQLYMLHHSRNPTRTLFNNDAAIGGGDDNDDEVTIVKQPRTRPLTMTTDGVGVMEMLRPDDGKSSNNGVGGGGGDELKGYRTRIDSSYSSDEISPATHASFRIGDNVAYYDHECRAYKVGTIKATSSSSSSSASLDTEYSIDVNGQTTPVRGYELLKCKTAPVKWRKGHMIGQGGFGSVWTAHHPNGTVVAMKQMNLRVDGDVESQIATIYPEIALMQTLDHPNIVKFLGSDINRKEARVYIFMEFVHGGSLKNLINDYGALPEEVVATYTIQMLNGLHYLHRNRIVHRDLKASNVLVDLDGRIRLADFGGSKKLQDVCHAGMRSGNGSRKKVMKTNLMTMVGSPYWMAPEVVKQEGYGRSADIWSLGCTVLELVSGHSPWQGYNQIAAVYAIGNTDTIPPFPSNISPDCADFLKSCLRRDPNERPSASDLLLHPWLASSSNVDATPQQFSSKHRASTSPSVQQQQQQRPTRNERSKFCLEIQQPKLIDDDDDDDDDGGGAVSIEEEEDEDGYTDITIESRAGVLRSSTPTPRRRGHTARQQSRDDMSYDVMTMMRASVDTAISRRH